MSHSVPGSDENSGASGFRWLVYANFGLGAILVILWTLREMFSASTTPPLAPLVVGFLLLLVTVPSAKLKKFQLSPKTGLTLEFHSTPPPRRVTRRT